MNKMMRFVLILLFVSSAFAQHSNTLTWVWTQGTSDLATGFHVQRASTSGGPYTTIATLNGIIVKTYVDNTVAPGQTWYYVVTAFNAGGDSVPSNQVVCTTPFQAPQTPTGLSGAVN